MWNTDINYWAVLASAVASMAIGALWYGPLFGKAWIKMMNFTPESMAEAKKKGMAKLYVAQFAVSFVSVYVLSVLLSTLGILTVWEGMKVAAFLWLGFSVPVQIGASLWGGKPVKFLLITAGSDLVTLLVAGAILSYWI